MFFDGLCCPPPPRGVVTHTHTRARDALLSVLDLGTTPETLALARALPADSTVVTSPLEVDSGMAEHAPVHFAVDEALQRINPPRTDSGCPCPLTAARAKKATRENQHKYCKNSQNDGQPEP